MSRYGGQYRKGQDEPKWRVHPIWRGIGCFFFLLIPLMAYSAAKLFVDTNAKMEKPMLSLPVGMMDKVKINGFDVPGTVISVPSNLFSRYGLRYADLVFTLAFLFVGFGLFSVVYGFAYRIIGPPRYSPLDSAPVVRSRPRKR